MQELQNRDTITSLELMEQINIFRKADNKANLLHYDLLKIIRSEFEEEINEGKISLVEYKDKKGELRPMYVLTLSQAKQVLVRESKAVRKAVIKYIETLENKIKNQLLPTTYKDALKQLLLKVEENEKLEIENKVKTQQIAELQPKACYYDVILQNKDLVSVTMIAKDYGKSAKWLNELLQNQKVQFKQNGIWILYQKYARLGYTQTKTQVIDGCDHVKVHTYWTQKGRLFIYDLLKELGHLPNMERIEHEKQ